MSGHNHEARSTSALSEVPHQTPLLCSWPKTLKILRKLQLLIAKMDHATVTLRHPPSFDTQPNHPRFKRMKPLQSTDTEQGGCWLGSPIELWSYVLSEKIQRLRLLWMSVCSWGQCSQYDLGNEMLVETRETNKCPVKEFESLTFGILADRATIHGLYRVEDRAL